MAGKYSPGGGAAKWLYGLAVGFLLFSGFAQMPIMKRYYIADIPGLAFSAEFFVTSFIHYLAAMLLLALLAWRVSLAAREGRLGWSWGPLSLWGWLLLAALAATGLGKALVNGGMHMDPMFKMILDLCHMGSAMAFMMTGLVAVIRGRAARQKAK